MRRSFPPLVLASGSARRHELLASIGLVFIVDAADIDESEYPGEDPRDYVVRLARAKARHVAARHGFGSVVIGADTTVELDGMILGKPDDSGHAVSMLRSLSGRTHRVHTGMAVVIAGSDHESWTKLSTTDVTFCPLDRRAIERYVATGEPMGKAGSYAIQGIGGALIAKVNGNVQNVVGLPLADLLVNQSIESLVRANDVTPVI